MRNSSKKNPLVGVAIASLWRSLLKDLFDTYHPERHYMRGPGPKWRAKHQSRTQAAAIAHLADVSI